MAAKKRKTPTKKSSTTKPTKTTKAAKTAKGAARASPKKAAATSKPKAAKAKAQQARASTPTPAKPLPPSTPAIDSTLAGLEVPDLPDTDFSVADMTVADLALPPLASAVDDDEDDAAAAADGFDRESAPDVLDLDETVAEPGFAVTQKIHYPPPLPDSPVPASASADDYPSTVPVSSSMITSTPTAAFGGIPGCVLRMLPRRNELVQRFDDLARAAGLDVEEITPRLFCMDETAPLEEVLPEASSADWSLQAFLLMALARAGAFRLPDDDIDGDYFVPAHDLLAHGDLHVRGDLTVEGRLLVLGDLRVDGTFTDVAGAHTAVTGLLLAGKSIVTRASLSVGGGTQSPCVVLDGDAGKAILLDGVEARLFVERAHKASRVQGALDVDFAVIDACMIDQTLPPLDKDGLKAALSPALADKVDDVELARLVGVAARTGSVFRA